MTKFKDNQEAFAVVGYSILKGIIENSGYSSRLCVKIPGSAQDNYYSSRTTDIVAKYETAKKHLEKKIEDKIKDSELQIGYLKTQFKNIPDSIERIAINIEYLKEKLNEVSK